MNPSDLPGDPIQTQPADLSSTALQKLQAQYESLRSLLMAMLVALVLLSFGVILFIGKQMTTVRAQLAAARPEAKTLMGEFKNKSEPLMRSFVGSLQMFATTNRDFQPILEKYRPALFPYFTGTSPAGMPSGPAPASPSQ